MRIKFGYRYFKVYAESGEKNEKLVLMVSITVTKLNDNTHCYALLIDRRCEKQ